MWRPTLRLAAFVCILSASIHTHTHTLERIDSSERCQRRWIDDRRLRDFLRHAVVLERWRRRANGADAFRRTAQRIQSCVLCVMRCTPTVRFVRRATCDVRMRLTCTNERMSPADALESEPQHLWAYIAVSRCDHGCGQIDWYYGYWEMKIIAVFENWCSQWHLSIFCLHNTIGFQQILRLQFTFSQCTNFKHAEQSMYSRHLTFAFGFGFILFAGIVSCDIGGIHNWMEINYAYVARNMFRKWIYRFLISYWTLFTSNWIVNILETLNFKLNIPRNIELSINLNFNVEMLSKTAFCFWFTSLMSELIDK